MRRLRIASLLLALGALLAACGSSHPTSTGPGRTGTGSSPSAGSSSGSKSHSSAGSSAKSGSPTAAASGTGSTASSTARAQAQGQVANCFRAHGINVPSSASGGGSQAINQALANYAPSQVQAALKDCHAYVARAFPILSLSPAKRAQFVQRQVRFAQCLRSHGLNLPKLTAISPTAMFRFEQAFRALKRMSPGAVRSAVSACRSLLLHSG